MRILVVEDDDRVARGLATALRNAGFDVSRVATAAAARTATPADVVLLDLGLPDADGIDVLRELRSRSETAVIAVTARAEETERVRGLRTGADDYVVKPFGVPELLARIEAVLRRTRAARAAAAPEQQPIRFGEMTVDIQVREVSLGDTKVVLARKEFDLLALLALRAPAVVDRATILDQVWGTSWEAATRTLDTHIAALRGKIGAAAWIQTVRGVGYRLRELPEPRDPHL